MYAVAAVLRDRDVLGSILFACALNHKQMSRVLRAARFSRTCSGSVCRARETIRARTRAVAAAGSRRGRDVRDRVGAVLSRGGPENAREGRLGGRPARLGAARAARARFARGLRRQLLVRHQPAFPVAEDGDARGGSGGARGDGRRHRAFHGAPDRAPYERGVPVVPVQLRARVFSCSVSRRTRVGAAPATAGAALAPADPDLAAWFPIAASLRDVAAAPEGQAARRVRRDGARVRRARGRGGAGRRGERGDERASVALERPKPNEATNIRAAGTLRGARALATRARRDVRRRRGCTRWNSSCRLRRGSAFLHDLPSRPCLRLGLAAAAYGNLRQREVAASAAPPANPESAAHATRASRRTASPRRLEWSLVRLAATPEPKTTRRRLTAIKKRNGEGR